MVVVTLYLKQCVKVSFEGWVKVSCDEFNINHNINQMPEVQVGETFEVKLCSNPSTGIRWSEEAQISDPAVLQQEDHKLIGPESLGL